MNKYNFTIDSDGVEIYEGDILKMDSISGLIGAVEYWGSGFHLLGEEMYDGQSYKVIGNIHEHKHLLEVE